MKKNYILLNLFIFLTYLSIAQDPKQFEWINDIAVSSNTGAIDVRTMDIDGNGNTYIAGGFTGSVDFDGKYGSYIKTSNGALDFFIAKYKTDGTLDYVRTGGDIYNDVITDIKVFGVNQFYITGTYIGTVNFGTHDDGGGCGSIIKTSPLDGGTPLRDLFIGKFSFLSDPCDFDWIETGGVDEDITAGKLTVDSNNDVYVTASFIKTSITVGSYTFTNANTNAFAPTHDIIMLKYDAPDGSLLWGKSFGGIKSETLGDITTDDTYIYLTGKFSGTTNFSTTATKICST